jgi:hypothetical protein
MRQKYYFFVFFLAIRGKYAPSVDSKRKQLFMS